MADRPAGVARRSSSQNATANPWPLPAWLLFWAETPGAFMTTKAIITRSLFIRGAYGGVSNWPSRFGVPPNFPFSRRTMRVRTSRVHVEVKINTRLCIHAGPAANKHRVVHTPEEPANQQTAPASQQTVLLDCSGVC